MIHEPAIEILPDAGALARRAADIFAGEARRRIREAGRFTVALSGGSTPRRLHRELARGVPPGNPLPWDGIHLFWGDERHVPPDHPDSNYRMARETLLDHVPVPEANIHRIPAERPEAPEAAAEYERTIHEILRPAPGRLPGLDLLLLGMGDDGHTASLFPGSSLLSERRRLVVAGRVEKLDSWRISMSLPLLNAGRRVLFLVSGAGKAGALREVLEGGRAASSLPAARVAPAEGELTWLVDEEAATLLQQRH